MLTLTLTRAQQDVVDSLVAYATIGAFVVALGWRALLLAVLIFVAAAVVGYVAASRRDARLVDQVGHTTINGSVF